MIVVSVQDPSVTPIHMQDSSAHVMLQVLGYMPTQAASVDQLEREVTGEDLQQRALVMLWAEEAIVAAGRPGFDPGRTLVRLRELEQLGAAARRHGTRVSWRHVA